MSTCAVAGCERTGYLFRGWCRPHYKRWARYGDPAGGGVGRTRPRRLCSLPDCDAEHYGYGYCALHHRRWRNHGDPHVVLPPSGPPPAPPLPECCIDGCQNVSKIRWRALCGMHDMRRRRQGSPLWQPPTRTERFWAFVERRDTGQCWPWRGAVLWGYGHFENLKPHRVAYEQLVGPIPAGLTLDHVCHTNDLECEGGAGCLHRRCVNPAHLEPVTLGENVRRGVDRARRRALSLETAA